MQLRTRLQVFCLVTSILGTLAFGLIGCADDEEEGLSIPHFTGCTPNSTFCVENAVAQCDADGLDYSLTIVCEGNRRATRTAISHYHKRRLARVDQIVSAALLASIAD